VGITTFNTFSAVGLLLGYFLWWLAMASVLVGPSHMFLDMFTEAGVYVKKKREVEEICISSLQI